MVPAAVVSHPDRLVVVSELHPRLGAALQASPATYRAWREADGWEVSPTYTSPFDLFVKGNETGDWLGGRDSNPDNVVQRRRRRLGRFLGI